VYKVFDIGVLKVSTNRDVNTNPKASVSLYGLQVQLAFYITVQLYKFQNKKGLYMAYTHH